MATAILSPGFLEVDDWRQIQKNNAPIQQINFTLVTDETWMPAVLSQAGFFSSNGEVKRNRPELWRDVVDNEVIRMGRWANIRVARVERVCE